MAQLMPLPLTDWSVASVKSRLVLSFWYPLTRVSMCVFVSLVLHNIVLQCVLWCAVCSDGNLFEFVVVSLDNKQWHFTAQSAEVDLRSILPTLLCFPP